MNPLFTLGEEFRFHSSRFHKKAGDAKFWFYHSFVPVLIGTLAETLIYNWERVERVPTLWLQTTPQETAMRKMMSLNCSICLMPIFGVGKVYRISTPKSGPPQYIRRVCTRCFAWRWPVQFIWAELAGRHRPIPYTGTKFSVFHFRQYHDGSPCSMFYIQSPAWWFRSHEGGEHPLTTDYCSLPGLL